MELFKALPVILIVFISGCATQISETTQVPTTPAQEQIQEIPPQPTPQPAGESTLQGEVTPTQQEQPPPLPTVKEFTIDADDRGFYIDNKDTSSVPVLKGEIVKITFKVREAGTYYGGLDFKGCGQDTPDTKPGASVEIQFTADQACTITSYWPASNVIKDSMQVIVS